MFSAFRRRREAEGPWVLDVDINPHQDEIERVLGAVTFISAQALCDEEDTTSVVREDHFAPFDSIFQETAWHDDYSDIMPELCRINTQEAFA